MDKEKDILGNPRIQALIKLSLYAIFFIILIVAVNNNYNKQQTNDNQSDEESSSIMPTIDYSLLKLIILRNQYDYQFNIYNNEKLVTTYDGKRNGSYFEGYKTSDNDYIKYIIENGKVYEVRLTTNVESVNVFKNIDINFLDSEYIIKYVSSTSPIISDFGYEKEYKYTVNNKYEITIMMDAKSIYQIKVLFLNTNIKYILKYTYK